MASVLEVELVSDYNRVSVEFTVQGYDSVELERLAEERLSAFAPDASARYQIEARPLVESNGGEPVLWEGTVTASWMGREPEQ